jgi:hypothetical protein
MKKATKNTKEKVEVKKKPSLKPTPGAQKETKYVKKNFFAPDEEDEDLDDDLEMDLDMDDDFEEDFNEEEEEDY